MLDIIQIVLLVTLVGVMASELIFKLHYLTVPRVVLNTIVILIGIVSMKSVVYTVISVIVILALVISTMVLLKERKDDILRENELERREREEEENRENKEKEKRLK